MNQPEETHLIEEVKIAVAEFNAIQCKHTVLFHPGCHVPVLSNKLN